MRVKIILNGGLKSCCSSYTSEMIYEIVKSWLKDTDHLDVIDVKTTEWVFDELSEIAKKYFGERIFPLVYIDDILISIGSIPDAHSLMTLGKNPQEYSISKEDILKVAKESGLLNSNK